MIKNRTKILIRSSWQTVNIGDIGHTPGLLNILQKYRPELELTLWPCDVGHGVKKMLQTNFPKVSIVNGDIDSPELRNAFAANDFLLHGSGPSVVCSNDIQQWHNHTAKPYGIFGVTIEKIDKTLRYILDHADFIYCRDTISLEFIRKQKIKCPVMEFGPDAAFSIDLHDDKLAKDFICSHKLEPEKFVCVIPRLRYTPYYKIHGNEPSSLDLEKEKISDQYKDIDHAKLREVIIKIIDDTDMKVLICPEMTYQVELGKELLYDLLPETYRQRVVWRDTYWRPDEAGSTYSMANCIISFEMHSPIIALAVGTPAIYLRQPTDTSKGQMWRDIGLNNWILEIDEVNSSDIATVALKIISEAKQACPKAVKALQYAQNLQEQAVTII